MAALSDEEQAIMAKLRKQIRNNRRTYTLLDRYFEGEQRLEQIGIAVAPELRRFTAAVNVPRMAVTEPVTRQNLRGFQRVGGGKKKSAVDKTLQKAWHGNNLTSRSMLLHQDARLYGRGFASVATNPDDETNPLITVESPENIGIDVSPLGQTRAVVREYSDDGQTFCTLYRPGITRWLVRGRNGWDDAVEPDKHGLPIPVVMFLNRQRTNRWSGVSEMADVIKKTDAIARLISNMQIGGEALAWPKRWAAGVQKSDFVDQDGKPMPVWETYMTVVMTAVNQNAKFGSFDAADLKNFHEAVDALLSWCAAELGLPLRFMGQEAVNPASEGAIKADESRLVKNVEWKNRFDGDSWAWLMGLWETWRAGKVIPGNQIRTLWFDPSTPTESQVADKVLKLHSEGVLSREGSWDELGWDEPRKDRERAYFAAEAADPMLSQLMDQVGAPSSGR